MEFGFGIGLAEHMLHKHSVFHQPHAILVGHIDNPAISTHQRPFFGFGEAFDTTDDLGIGVFG